ncbi:probable serine/threonine-protein kinase CPE1738 [Arthrobacter sp. Hiyo6]|nr:probable serine/threonine-protein kinase CPE1738 [Arthrobacter sp. Hiyo6]
MQVKLKSTEWEIGSVLGTGGFGSVFEAKSPNGDLAAAKFIPKKPGAKREMLFEDSLADVRNVIPILDTGEDDDHWIIIMPRASHSLRDALEKGPLGLDDARRVLEDVADALADLKGKGIVHRDLKPENVLWLEGAWCLADFGISRYAEAATAASTNKYSWTYPYAAPEQWRLERATSATDIYALGVMGFELLNGSRPFTGNDSELREAHLHNPVPPSNAPKKLGWLIEECLEKSPEARPSPADFRRRLDLSLKGESAAGLSLWKTPTKPRHRNGRKSPDRIRWL